eukprot:9316158-Karenia_brevis.AAC.1
MLVSAGFLPKILARGIALATELDLSMVAIPIFVKSQTTVRFNTSTGEASLDFYPAHHLHVFLDTHMSAFGHITLPGAAGLGIFVDYNGSIKTHDL